MLQTFEMWSMNRHPLSEEHCHSRSCNKTALKVVLFWDSCLVDVGHLFIPKSGQNLRRMERGSVGYLQMYVFVLHSPAA